MKNKSKNSNRIIITKENYSQLFFTDKNRMIKKPHVKLMQDSILEHGCLRLVVVVWDRTIEKYIVVDGQHLSKALMNLNRPIECHVVKCETEQCLTKLMIDLNNISKSWKPMDYIHGWAESGNKDYQFLKNVLVKNKLQLSVVLMAYSQKKRMVTTKEIINGTYEIANIPYGTSLLSNVEECNKYVPNTRAMNESLIKLMISVKNYNHEIMMKNLMTIKNVVFEVSEPKIFKQLLNIYER